VEQGKPDEELNLQTDASDIGMSGARFQRYGGQTIKGTNSIEEQQDEQTQKEKHNNRALDHAKKII
jgi:hypothetical protein